MRARYDVANAEAESASRMVQSLQAKDDRHWRE